MTHDELAELMGEPPGGHNHGRKRVTGGSLQSPLGSYGWRTLETNEYDVTEDLRIIHDPDYRGKTTAKHGTRARYVHGRCRCDECRRANREYIRQRRAGL